MKPKLTPREQQVNQINNNFSYHKPIKNQAERYEEIREGYRELAYVLINLCPESRELSIALTNLEQSCMWANASIARNEKEDDET